MAEERQIGPGERAAIEAGKEAYREAIRTAEQRVRELADVTSELNVERKREPIAPPFWKLPGAPEAVSPEPKSERSHERQRQQQRDDFGFSL